MNKPVELQNQREPACHICGEISYSWGHIGVKYKRDDTSFVERAGGLSGYEVSARACNNCGNIQLFIRE